LTNRNNDYNPAVDNRKAHDSSSLLPGAGVTYKSRPRIFWITSGDIFLSTVL